MTSLQGYECNQCHRAFEEVEPCEFEVKCPACGSTDVTASAAASELLELIQEMGRTGG